MLTIVLEYNHNRKRIFLYLQRGLNLMPLTESQKQARYNYAKKSLKRIPLDVQKEKYEEIKTAASAAGESVNGYIKKAVDQRIENEKFSVSESR